MRVRPRSALGLKYIDLTPGTSADERCKPAPRSRSSNSMKPIELDEFFSTFDEEFRDNQRGVLEGFGNALAGRGGHINHAIDDLRPVRDPPRAGDAALSDPTPGSAEFFARAATSPARSRRWRAPTRTCS